MDLNTPWTGTSHFERQDGTWMSVKHTEVQEALVNPASYEPHTKWTGQRRTVARRQLLNFVHSGALFDLRPPSLQSMT